MKWNSFRLRLSLWNAAVLGVILGGFGLALCYSNQHRMQAALDNELLMRTRQFTTESPGFFPHFGDPHTGHDPPGQPGGFFPRPNGPGPEWGMPGGNPAPDPHDPRYGGGKQPERGAHRPERRIDADPGISPPEGMESLLNGDAARLAAVRRPRLLNREGQGFGPYSDGPWEGKSFETALGGRECYVTIEAAGERLRVCSVPWRREGEVIGVVQIARELRDYEAQSGSQFRTLWMLMPLSLLAAWMGGLFLTNRALRPIRAVTQAAAQLSDQDLSRRLTVEGEDEMAELSATFNSMIARLHAAFQSREKAYTQLEGAYEQQRRFTADASHELRTPLSRIKVSTSMALVEEQTAEEYRRALQITDRAADAMGSLIQQLLLLTRVDAGQMPFEAATVDMTSVLCEAVAGFTEQGRAPIALELPSEPLIVHGDRDHLGRVFVNLLENALRYTPADGRIVVSAVSTPEQVAVSVTDTGIGIAPEHLPHVMERFYRVDASRTRSGGGCGLGLAIAQSIVQAHGGELTLRSEVGKGTVATVALPTPMPG